MASVLVTGGSGFVGSLLAARLLRDGHTVTSLDLLPAELRHPRLAPIRGDIRDRAGLDLLLRESRPDAIFHCAARLAHEKFDTKLLWSCNVAGTAALADAAAAAGVRRLVYLSSNCLWGHGFDRPVGEDEPPAPIEPYGRSKWESETILRGRLGPAATILRCPTIIDEGRLGLLAILFEFIAEGRRLWTVGAGDNRYQFIYATDLIDAMLRSWHLDVGGVYGIGSDNVTTLRETYAQVIADSGSRSRIHSLPKAPAMAAMKLAHRLGLSPLGPYHYRMIASTFVFDTRRIKAALGWQPTLTNSEMLSRAYRYYHANRVEIAARKNVSAHRRAAEMGAIRILKWLS